MTEFRRVALSTGVDAQRRAGRRSGQARRDPAPRLSRIAPHLARDRTAGSRTTSSSSCPTSAGSPGRTSRRTSRTYTTDTLVDDIFALADALELERFALVGHDWGGAIAWAAALRGDPRLTRLAIINAPHPLIFQKSLIEDADQRAASQYITAFRTPGFEQAIEANGL